MPRLRFAQSLLHLWPALIFIGVAVVSVLVSVWYARSTLTEVAKMTEVRQQVHLARIGLKKRFDLLLDMESGMRGYVITGREEFLEPYNEGVSRLAGATTASKALLHRAQVGLDSLEELEALQRVRVGQMKTLVDRRRQIGVDLLEDQNSFRQGKVFMDQLRGGFSALEDMLVQKALDIDSTVETLRTKADLAATVALGAVLSSMALGVYLLTREHLKRLALEADLMDANAHLGQEVDRRTVELSQALGRLNEFAVEQERAIEAERRRLSREVHDRIGQVFTAIKLILASIPASAYPPGQKAVLDQALEMGITSTRRITADLRPPLLDDLGLAAAVEHLAAQLSTSGRLAIDVDIHGAAALRSDQALGLFRIVQEALTNVLRHSQASRVNISGGIERQKFSLRIVDNGVGMPAQGMRPGAMGVVGMKERARLLGAECSVAPGVQGGVEVLIDVPLAEKKALDERTAA